VSTLPIPTEEIIRAYMDEAVEHEEEVTIEPILEDDHHGDVDEDKEDKAKEEEDKAVAPTLGVSPLPDDEEPVTTRLTFNDVGSVLDEMNHVSAVEAPKTIERLEEISMSNALQRKLEEEDEEEEDELHIKIGGDVDLGQLDVLDPGATTKTMEPIPLLDVEELF
jgi:hypothetical protein